MSNFAEFCNRTLPPGGGCHLLTPPIPIDSSCDIENRYTKHFYAGSLEVCVMALRQWEHTQDATRDASRLIALSDAVLTFYREHWRWSTINGTMHLLNSSGQESWPRCDDPPPELAGMAVLLDGLLAMPPHIAAASTLGPDRWRQMAASIPPLPLSGNSIAPCRASHLQPDGAPAQIEGCEGVEMYPYGQRRSITPFSRLSFG